ncbi:inosine 5'-monophosphate dehydrogenase [Enhygromyxa salina]|uniref:Inosine 5'-monophosphate dehydrogenase n=1 Tax=Enhygromyxa salina TaxID=215803 RepID=A0A2S9XID6_9BACT|nr:CBS domain-containing protein [Enhygromyxa salina]PRP92649.1 inosine 5'-monophosphate dehydrogenase [Enhygromyxa salina]
MTRHELPLVSDYMTELPVTVETGMRLSDALDRMYSDNIRHLPVVDDEGKLVGLISTRDIAAAAALRGIDPDVATVEMAMATVPFSCAEHSPLLAVVERMERDRLGSAIVTREDRPSGIFTTTDALRALRGQLLGEPVERLVRPEVAPGEGEPGRAHLHARTRIKGASHKDGMVSWFLTRF